MLSIKNACQQLSFNIRKVSNYNKLGHAQIGLFNQVLSLNCGHSFIVPYYCFTVTDLSQLSIFFLHLFLSIIGCSCPLLTCAKV